ncbi:hypothetical protein Poli38472_001973 [Pythium oligandrum]|uniref:Transmembrane protein n=1 Tax=Pythium oligandrum TaxID=41045 RepID=A0A8K1CTU4_PYTOL|nr:hypothetical protein Poli38472_001973 [Pythium oligandrum]|eukprot:TMW69817.1 hypothetical protein Poli38472_001973 [Pythium oligandrum]
MPAKSGFVSTSGLFDIDENEHIASDHAPPPPRKVSIQPPEDELDSDAILGDSVQFQRQNSLTRTVPSHSNASSYQPRHRARSRRYSVSPWTLCGRAVPAMTIRALTTLLVLPLLIAGLVWIPAITVIWLALLCACVGVYEYSWLAFRLHYQLLTTYNWYERAPLRDDIDVVDEDEPRFHFQSFAAEDDGDYDPSKSIISINPSDFGSQRGRFESDAVTVTSSTRRRGETVSSPLDMLEFAGAATAVSSIAEDWCGGREWIALLVLSIAISALWSVVSYYLVEATTLPVALLPPSAVLIANKHQITWIASFGACLSALSSPNLRSALSLILQLMTFYGMVLNALSCPLGSNCVDSATGYLLTTTEWFALGAVLIFIVRGLTSTTPADMILVTMLDLLGYVYVMGSLAVVINVVTVQDSSELYSRLLLLVVIVLSVAQIAADVCNALLKYNHRSRWRVLPARIAVRLDVEALLCACVAGIGAMTLTSGVILDIPAPIWVNIIVAFVAVVVMRLGTLFHGLLRRAAGVRWTNRILPGFGGVLDLTHALVFAGGVFVKLYVVMLHTSSLARDQIATDAPSLNFGSIDTMEHAPAR